MAASAPAPSSETFAGIRFLFLINADQGGGVEQLASAMAAHFRQQGAEIVTQAIYSGDERGTLDKLRAVTRASRRFIATPADIVVTFQPTAAAIMGLFGPLTGRRVRIAHRSNMPEVTAWAPKWADRILGSIGGFTVNISNSSATEAAYGQYPKAYLRRLRRIDHGVDVRAPQIDRAGLRERLGIPDGARLAASVSRLAPIKAIDVFIRALKFMPGVIFAVGGEGADRQRLEAVARECNVIERVRFIGRLDRQGVADLDAGCDVFIAPSRSETFGLSVAEAAMQGAPVIARDLDVMREVLAAPTAGDERHVAPYAMHGAAAFVNGDDPEVWAAATFALMDGHDLSARRDAQRSAMSTRFGEDRMLQRYDALIREQLRQTDRA